MFRAKRGQVREKLSPLVILAFMTLGLTACGGGSQTGNKVGGSVTGMTGSGLVLQLNGGNDLAINANGPFSFPAEPNGTTYSVTVKTDPTSPAQTCHVVNGSGILAGADISSIAVICAWTKEVGVTGGPVVGSALAVDHSGNIFIGGITNTGLDGNTSTGAVFVTEYNASGGWLKTNESGVADMMILSGVAVDGGGNIVSAGYTYTNYGSDGYPTGCIGRLAKSGSASYSIQIGAATYDTVVNGVAMDASGNAYVVGSTTGDLGATLTGSKDLFLAKYDSSGNAVFTLQYGVSGYATVARSVAVDGSGNVLVAYDSGNYDPVGATGGSHNYVAKYSSSGTLLATYQADSTSGVTQAASLAVDGGGNIFVAYMGQDLGTYGSFLAKLSPSGSPIFASFQLPSQFGSYLYNNIASSVAVDASGNVLVAGSLMINGIYSGGYVAKYDGAGNKVYLNQIFPDAAGYTLNVAAVAVDSSGNTYVAGSMTGNLDGNPWSGYMSYFLVKYDAMGNKQ